MPGLTRPGWDVPGSSPEGTVSGDAVAGHHCPEAWVALLTSDRRLREGADKIRRGALWDRSPRQPSSKRWTIGP